MGQRDTPLSGHGRHHWREREVIALSEIRPRLGHHGPPQPRPAAARPEPPASLVRRLTEALAVLALAGFTVAAWALAVYALALL